MSDLWLYDKLSQAKWLNYRAKIMLVAFVGTHIPLLAIIVFFIVGQSADWKTVLFVVGVALAATLVGTAATLLALNSLLRPILVTSQGLRSYRTHRTLPQLPSAYADEVGTLMADAKHTLIALDTAIDEMANYDKVTGLPNRDRFLTFVADRMAREERIALCAVRLANYERLVSTFDQNVADEALRLTANRLAAEVGPRAFPSRIEAGLFAFALGSDGDVDALTSRTEQTLSVITAEATIGKIQVLLEVTSGAAFYPEDASSAEALLGNAIGALPACEASAAPQKLNFFSAEMREAARTRFATEQELRRALADEEFRLHFQPVVDMSLGSVISAEALVRWQHPEKGLLHPGAFIPVAEAGGLMDRIDRWVLGAACAQLKRWSQEGLEELKIGINLSARQFNDPDLIATIRGTLDENGVAPGGLEIELTETAAMNDGNRTRQAFGRLRDLGVSVAIDDFGTGYSSMRHLKALPFDKLKIDREFVTDVHRSSTSRAICATIISLTRGLGIEVLAEGTENEDEVRELYGLGCHLFQGYYFAKPMPADALRKTIAEGQIGPRVVSAMSGVLRAAMPDMTPPSKRKRA